MSVLFSLQLKNTRTSPKSIWKLPLNLDWLPKSIVNRSNIIVHDKNITEKLKNYSYTFIYWTLCHSQWTIFIIIDFFNQNQRFFVNQIFLPESWCCELKDILWSCPHCTDPPEYRPAHYLVRLHSKNPQLDLK